VPDRRRANPLALAVLACLGERPMHPYEMAQTLRTRAKHESVRLNYGSLYAVVESLERRKLVRARETVREGRRPERTIYEITDRGQRELVDWLTELVAEPVKEYLQFEAALSFLPVLVPEEALQALRLRCEALEVRLAQSRSVYAKADEAGLPRLFLLESDYQMRLLEAELGWTRELVDELENDRLVGLKEWRMFHDENAPPDSGEDPKSREGDKE
jgi:DNA-binding PadR family transcriptional regulator